MLFSVFLSAVLYLFQVEDIEVVNLESRTNSGLFNLARLKATIKVRQLCVRKLLHTDNDALVSTKFEKLQEMLLRFSRIAPFFGLQINIDKTEIM